MSWAVDGQAQGVSEENMRAWGRGEGDGGNQGGKEREEKRTEHHEAYGVGHLCRLHDHLDDAVAGLDEGASADADQHLEAVDVGRRRVRISEV